MYILGIRIDNLTKKEIIKRINYFLGSSTFHQVVTVNPEFILKAQKDKEFKSILNSKNTLNIADGIGLKFAAWRYGQKLKHRFTGVALLQEVLEIAKEKKMKVFLIANKDGLSTWQETAEVIKKIYPNLEVGGVNIKIGTFRRNQVTRLSNLVPTECQIVFCSLGAPYQEKLIALLKKQKNTNIKLAIGVGGSFDFLTGKITRAPKWMQLVGFEWLWRLILEPRYRIKKIFNAVVIFPIKIIFSTQVK